MIAIQENMNSGDVNIRKIWKLEMSNWSNNKCIIIFVLFFVLKQQAPDIAEKVSFGINEIKCFFKGF